MNDFRPIGFVVGLLLCFLAVGMIVPAVIDVASGSPDWRVFIAAAGATGFIGGGLALATRARAFTINVRQAFLLTTASWVVVIAFSALPFLFFTRELSLADAVFEATSGLTTTGATILVGLDHVSPGILMWRAILHWLGGLGIVAMAILILPLVRVGGMQLFRAESSDRSDKVVPRPLQLAAHLGLIYFGLTATCAVAYALAGMSALDAVAHAMSAVATGGFSTHDASIGYFQSPAIEWISILFMLGGGLPFVLYIRFVRGQYGALLRDQQVHGLLALMVVVSVVLAVWLSARSDHGLLVAFRLALFQVTSVVTTTGFVAVDYGLWGAFSDLAFFLLLFVGACSGSTAGGIKIFRFQVLAVVAGVQIRRLIQPHGVFTRSYSGRPLPEDVPLSVLAFVFLYIATVGLIALALSVYDLDLVTSLSAAAAAVGNIGPGLGPVVGPCCAMASLPDGAKWFLSLAMLLGRLELFTVLVLFSRAFWHA
ncbi:MAG: TrkH family potassium uptake protein [Alphaproteobacteria bacterium]|nr:TrkH family potassium uptake protein [Alphaproteobacteria bacterium]